MGVRATPIDTPITVGRGRRTLAEATQAVTGLRVEEPSPVCTGQQASDGARGERSANYYYSLPATDLFSYLAVVRALKLRSPVRMAPARRADRPEPIPGVFLFDRRLPSSVELGLGPRYCYQAYVAAPAPGTRTLTRLPRVALYRPWTGNIDEGWTRWVLEQFEFPYTALTDSVVKAGRLRDQFDAVIVPSMNLREMREGVSATQAPPPYAGGLGAGGLAELRKFAESGGTLVLLDEASELATAELGVPVKRITVAAREGDTGRSAGADSAARGRTGDQLYAPGSIFRVLVDNTHPVAYGMPDTAAVYFTNSVTFDVAGAGSPVRIIARYPERGEDILLSGYLQGGALIAGKAAAVEAPVGGGRVVMFGFRAQYRGQSYGTFRMLFNALLSAGGRAGRP
jgi:hypothetical protein